MNAHLNITPQVGIAENQQLLKLKQRLCLGNWILLITFFWAVIAITVGFILELHFSLAWQIAAHISLILCSITLKIGYLLRSFALKQLGQNNF